MIELDDLDAALAVVDGWNPRPPGIRQQLALGLALVRACGLVVPPRRPQAELRLRGERHTVSRDRRAVRHHYNVGNDFFALFLDSSMTYSCACFSRGARTLEEAQEAKLELVCSKLGLAAGERVLDVGCGWGSFALHAAVNHGAHVVGITLSEPQAELARERAKIGLGCHRRGQRLLEHRHRGHASRNNRRSEWPILRHLPERQRRFPGLGRTHRQNWHARLLQRRRPSHYSHDRRSRRSNFRHLSVR